MARSDLVDAAFGFMTHLAEELGPRESATPEELKAAKYLASQLEGFGYSVELQPFTMVVLSPDLSGFSLIGPEPQDFDVFPLLRSATGDVSGGLAAVGLARAADIPIGSLESKIAFAERGLIPFEEKVNRAAEAGAVAVVIYNNLPGSFQGILLSQGPIPAVAISQEDGRLIEELLAAGPVSSRVSVRTEELISRNVVGEKPGRGDGVVVLGGHYDTVPNVSGANDNASGTAVLLAIAQRLAEESLPFTVRFIAFGSEELGLRGSKHYVASLTEAELGRIRAMLNFDALGTGPQVAVLGDRVLTGLALEQGDAANIEVRSIAGLQGGDSDHSSFADVGVPVLSFFASDFSRIHTPRDTVDFVERDLMGDSAALALEILRSPEFLAVLK